MSLNQIRFGAYVWYGFSYHGEHYTDRLFREFPDRAPIWGWVDNKVTTMEYQIRLAKESGLDFFAFDWYYGKERLNNGVRNFVQAANRRELSFCLMVGNHGSVRIKRTDWSDACRRFVSYMSMENALRVDGKPVIILYDITNLIEDLGSVETVRYCLDELRTEMERYGGCYVMGCESPYGTPGTGAIDFNVEAFSEAELKNRLKRDAACGFDALTGYNYRRYAPMNGSYELPYAVMTKQHEICWDAMADCGNLPYAPCLLAGWDCRPWETEWPGNLTGYRSCYAPDRSPEVLAAHIRHAADWIDTHPAHRAGELAFLYAWDEVCEGGYLIPTKGTGFSMLEGLKAGIGSIRS